MDNENITLDTIEVLTENTTTIDTIEVMTHGLKTKKYRCQL